MKRIITILVFLFLANIIFAQNERFIDGIGYNTMFSFTKDNINHSIDYIQFDFKNGRINLKYITLEKNKDFNTTKAKIIKEGDTINYPKHIFADYYNKESMKSYLVWHNSNQYENGIDTLLYFENNSFGNTTIYQEHTFGWCGNDNSPNQWKYKYYYNSENRLIKIITQYVIHERFNTNVEKKWVDIYLNEFKFDDDGNEIEKIYSTYDSTYGGFVNNRKNEFIFIGSQLSEIVSYHWDKPLSTWIKDNKTMYYIESDIEFSEYFKWNSGDRTWDKRSRIGNYTINNKSIKLDQFWLATSQKWVNKKRIIKYPSGINNFEIKVEEKWDMIPEEWVKESWNEISISNDTIINITYNKDRKHKSLFVYNNENKLEFKKSYSFKKDVWKADRSFSYEYDQYHNISKIIQTDLTDTGFNQYVNETKYYWIANQLSKINQLEEYNFTISPNPSSGTYYIDLKNTNSTHKNISVFDLSGKMVYSDYVSGDDYYLDLSRFKNGVYFVNINNRISKKIIKE